MIVQVIAILIPLAIIPLLYTYMLFVICRNKIKCRRFFATCSAIVVSGMCAYLPSALTSIFDISMSYEFAQILTVTIYYSTSIVNPIIYFCLHPRAKYAIKCRINQDFAAKTISHGQMSSLQMIQFEKRCSQYRNDTCRLETPFSCSITAPSPSRSPSIRSRSSNLSPTHYLRNSTIFMEMESKI